MGGGQNPRPLRQCKFLLGEKKCLECSEMQEYAINKSAIFVKGVN